MVDKVADLKQFLQSGGDTLARDVAYMWDTWNTQRRGWLNEKQELRNYIFATDTSTTSNQDLPWKNRTTVPKLTQIRDNLHANYLSTLIPNDNWLTWEAYTKDSVQIEKRKAIEAYIDNKARESNLRTTLSELLMDYIDYGNAFATVDYVHETKTDPSTDEEIPGYIGPKVRRISPLDIVFNPTAESFTETPSIERKIMSYGELELMAQEYPEYPRIAEAVERARGLREYARRYSWDDFEKVEAFSVDGFGSLYEYLQSGYVEILEFEGNYHDSTTGTTKKNRRIIVVDRQYVLSDEEIPSWINGTTRMHVGWRLRQDNLYAMGPLDNLVGMQYRIDHLENLRADVFDLIAFPPLVIKGEVQDFEWEPLAKIIISDEDGSVDMLTPDTQALNADFQIQLYEQKMEELAGAPKQAMGIRTPGEKTAFEVQALENAAGRIFQEKITNFEINLLEPLVNRMLETAARNMQTSDIVRVMDDDNGVVNFTKVTRADITAKGKLRPIGARHFAQQAQTVQNLNLLLGGPLGQMVGQHFSGVRLAKLMAELIGVSRYDLVHPNIRVTEDAETQQLMNEAVQETDTLANTESI